MLRRALWLLPMLLVTGTAWAQQTGESGASSVGKWYVGAFGGWTDVNDNGIKDSSAGFRLAAGFHAASWLDGEVAYTDLGKFSANGSDLKIHGIEASAFGKYPINPRTNIFGKVGFYGWDTSGISSDTGIDPTWGLGANYKLTDKVGVRATYDQYVNIKDTNVTMISLGATYDF